MSSRAIASAEFYTDGVPLKATLPSDFEARLAGLGDAIAASCPGVLFVYLFGSAATGTRTPRSDVDLAVFAAPGVDAHGTQLAVARAAARQLGTMVDRDLSEAHPHGRGNGVAPITGDAQPPLEQYR